MVAAFFIAEGVVRPDVGRDRLAEELVHFGAEGFSSDAAKAVRELRVAVVRHVGHGWCPLEMARVGKLAEGERTELSVCFWTLDATGLDVPGCA